MEGRLAPAVTAYTDGQACVVAKVGENGDWRHQRSIPRWAALDRHHAATQRRAVRDLLREQHGDVLVGVRIVPGYCDECQG